MTDYISAELAATCDALGYFDGSTYHLDSHALNVIKDLIKYLKRDDDTHTVRRYLGQTKLLETDLIQIFIQHHKNGELWDVLLRLIINLTSPALMIYNEELPTEKTSRNHYLQLVSYLQCYKKAFTDERIWAVVSERLGTILKIDISERGEENELIIERILTLIRNALQVPPDDNEKRVDNDATVHDEVLFALNASGIVDLLLFIASNRSEQQFHMQIIEIIELMLREQNASKLASVGLQRTAAEKEREEAKLLAIRRKEITEKMEKMKKYTGSRHSRFGGTFVVQNMKAIGENQLICHKPFQKVESLDFSRDKSKVKKPKNRVLVEPPSEERLSALSVRLFLKEFCVEFLIGAYNPVMRYTKSCIIGESNSYKSDAVHYFWAMRFFMEFNRHYKFQVKYVSETVSTEIFYLIQRQIEQYYEMVITDKKKSLFWSRRLHVALKAYQELLYTLSAMDKTADKEVRDSSKIIKSNIFYVPEYRETILSQLLGYDGLKMSRIYLVDLLTTVHIFLKMLEQFCAQGRNIVVAKKKARRRKNVKRNLKGKIQRPVKSLNERWDETSPELSAVMQEGTIPTVIPFDAASDIPIDDQKGDAMKKIQTLLRRKEFEEAVGLLRAAREVWPENDCFGRKDIPVEEEFLALQEIFFTDLGVEDEAEKPNEENVESFLNNEDGEAEDDDEDNEEEEAEREVQLEETNFVFIDFVRRFANIKVVKAMTTLLQNFNDNSVELNHYILKLLHRIAYDCKMSAMMFQASLFRVFQKILDSKHAEHKELQKFAIFIIRQFTEVAKKNRKAYMELLFWKNTREATEMVEGYDAPDEKKKVSSAVWSEAEEDELRTLFMEHQTNKYPQDLIDWLLENIISEDRTRRSIIKKLKEMHLIVNSKAIRSEVQKRLPKEWGEEEIAQLNEMWENVKDDDDPVDLIYGGLRIKRPKPKIKEKLLELGLAKDRKELRKKRKSRRDNSKAKNNRSEDSDEEAASLEKSHEIDSDEDDADDERDSAHSDLKTLLFKKYYGTDSDEDDERVTKDLKVETSLSNNHHVINNDERISKNSSVETSLSKNHRLIDNDKDDDDEDNNKNNDKDNYDDERNSDIDTPSLKKRRIIDSDEDNDENNDEKVLKNSVVETPSFKKRRVIDSDEDDDDQTVSGVSESKQIRKISSDEED
ncbi:protein timeless homolog isoform X2 [Chelonus insularis]|uniref:protein timeless homolog isoform X2 n=1 Tax=Chelonus insularis TaxID=460826 RepID=UPI00158D4127|nr:protein timeless homolog isoform X2 [Chelonus insularis]